MCIRDRERDDYQRDNTRLTFGAEDGLLYEATSAGPKYLVTPDQMREFLRYKNRKYDEDRVAYNMTTPLSHEEADKELLIQQAIDRLYGKLCHELQQRIDSEN